MAKTSEERKSYRREYRAKNKERVAAYQKAYREKNKERVEAYEKRRRETWRSRLLQFRTHHGRSEFLSLSWAERMAAKYEAHPYCPGSGVFIDLRPPPPGVARRWNAPSFDQIVPGAGYTEDNVWIVSWFFNQAKGEMTLELFKQVMVGTADFMRLKYPDEAALIMPRVSLPGETAPILGVSSTLECN